jgi:carbonic anhydrase
MKENLKKLLDGNKRCAVCKPKYPRQGPRRRKEIAKGQKPFAVVVGCSDSRIPPELVFDQGFGDLFVVRVAGNIADDVALGSVEYAVSHLGTELVVVLGHGSCGAVTAATKGGKAHGHLAPIMKALKPAVQKAKRMSGDLVDNAIRANVELVVHQIRTSEPVLASMVKEGKVDVVGAYYDLESGRVELI